MNHDFKVLIYILYQERMDELVCEKDQVILFELLRFMPTWISYQLINCQIQF